MITNNDTNNRKITNTEITNHKTTSSKANNQAPQEQPKTATAMACLASSTSTHSSTVTEQTAKDHTIQMTVTYAANIDDQVVATTRIANSYMILS